jgi:hypothetical protein
VLRQLKTAAGEDITAADFTPDEADQLRLWTETQQHDHGRESGRHRNKRSRRLRFRS